jgi:hypothetical protein
MASLDRDGVDRRLACSERVLGWLNPSRLQVRMSTQYPHRRDTTHPKLLAFAAFNIHSLTLPGHAHMRSDQAPLLIGSDLALHHPPTLADLEHQGVRSQERGRAAVQRPGPERLEPVDGRLGRPMSFRPDTGLIIMDVLTDGIVFGESPRWRNGSLWFSDWGAGRVYSVAPGGTSTVEAEIASFPMCIDFLPDGRLLVVSSADRQLIRREPDGSLIPHADLAPVSTKPWNDIVVDQHGNAYVNSIGFNFPGEDFAPGIIVLVTRDGTVIPVAAGLCLARLLEHAIDDNRPGAPPLQKNSKHPRTTSGAPDTTCSAPARHTKARAEPPSTGSRRHLGARGRPGTHEESTP